MRHKYRAWLKEEKKMIFGHAATSNPHFTSMFNYRLSEIELMECIGLTDKNGAEMYESDIVKDKFGDLYVVRWNEHWAAFCVAQISGAFTKGGFPWYNCHNPFYHGASEYEIVGNIHNNSELLNYKPKERD